MPLTVLVILGVLILGAVGMWLTFTLMQMLVTLAIAGLVGWLADAVVPGRLPYGWLGAVAAGVIGGWIGGLILGNAGPALFGVHVLPAFVGAVICAGGAELWAKRSGRRELQEG